jgi:hypothetical protein
MDIFVKKSCPGRAVEQTWDLLAFIYFLATLPLSRSGSKN